MKYCGTGTVRSEESKVFFLVAGNSEGPHRGMYLRRARAELNGGEEQVGTSSAPTPLPISLKDTTTPTRTVIRVRGRVVWHGMVTEREEERRGHSFRGLR